MVKICYCGSSVVSPRRYDGCVVVYGVLSCVLFFLFCSVILRVHRWFHWRVDSQHDLYFLIMAFVVV